MMTPRLHHPFTLAPVGPGPYGDVLASLPGGVQRIVLSNPGYPDPFAAGAAPPPPSIVVFAPDIRVPYLTHTLGRASNDSGGVNWFPANDYDLSGEWARADFDRRHRFQLLGRIMPGKLIDLGIGLSVQSGAPYSASIGADVFNNARGGARPAGLRRNSLEGGGYASLDLRAAKDVTFAKGTPQARTLTISIDAFNVLNQVNYTGDVGTIESPLFAQPTGARPPRQLQVSTHVKF